MIPWPESLTKAHAVDQLAVMLAQARASFYGKRDFDWIRDLQPWQRQLFLDLAESLLAKLEHPDHELADVRLRRCADAVARHLELVK